MKLYDAVVVGEGPAGITAALYLARSGCSVLLFENVTPGGQILQTADIENYPGYPDGIKGYELADLFARHLEGLQIDMPRGEISAISGEAGNFSIQAQAGEQTYKARTVVVCSGAKHRLLGVPREEELIGRGVSYCALCDGNFYRNQDVALVGGGNAALEESLYMSRIARKVHLIHRRDEFRGAKIYLDKLEAMPEKVEIHRSTIIEGLLGDKGLDGIVIRDLANSTTSTLAVQGLFIYVGFIPVTSFLHSDVKTDAQGFIITDTEMRTSVPGIFAAGDIRSKLCRQVITAAGDGATAAQAAFVFLEQLHA